MFGVFLMIKPWFNPAVIPYHITVTTGIEYDSSTDSRVFIIIMGPQKVQTERLWLDLPEGKDEFADGSVEKFSVWGLDVGEIKKVEVICAVWARGHLGHTAKETTDSMALSEGEALGSAMNVGGKALMQLQ